MGDGKSKDPIRAFTRRGTHEITDTKKTSPLRPQTPARSTAPFVSMVMPVFNEREVLDRLSAAVSAADSAACCATRCRFEIVFVDDGPIRRPR